jgi:hypothetical protein
VLSPVNANYVASVMRMCANLRVMRQFRYALLSLLFGTAVSPFPAHACVVTSIPTRVQPTFSVHVYNDLGPVKGLKLKVVTGGGDSDALAEATTDDKGIAGFQLQRFLWGGALFLEPEHTVVGWEWPQLYIETNSTKSAKSAIDVYWPSRVLRSRNLRGTIQLQAAPFVGANLSLRTLVSYEEIATSVTDETGAFRFARIKPGLYYLQVNGESKSDPRLPQGNIAVFIGGTEADEGLSIITSYSDCGLDYKSGEDIHR